ILAEIIDIGLVQQLAAAVDDADARKGVDIRHGLEESRRRAVLQQHLADDRDRRLGARAVDANRADLHRPLRHAVYVLAATIDEAVRLPANLVAPRTDDGAGEPPRKIG